MPDERETVTADASMVLVIAMLSELEERGVISLEAISGRVANMREHLGSAKGRDAAGTAMLALAGLTGRAS